MNERRLRYEKGNISERAAVNEDRDASPGGRVAYDSLEEGACKTMQNAFIRTGMQDVARRMVLLDCEDMATLSERLKKRRSPEFVVVDSLQYTGMSYSDFRTLKERHRDKLLIFISQARGTQPSSRVGVSVMYDAGLKIWVEGYRAFSKGRTFGEKGYYTVWPERAEKYWGK